MDTHESLTALDGLGLRYFGATAAEFARAVGLRDACGYLEVDEARDALEDLHRQGLVERHPVFTAWAGQPWTETTVRYKARTDQAAMPAARLA